MKSWKKKAKRLFVKNVQKENLKEAKGKVCNKCGKCCVGFHLPVKTLSQDQINYFSYHENVEVQTLEGGQLSLFFNNKCKHLAKDNLCAIYETRPDVCRDAYTKNRQGVIFPEGCSMR